MLIIWGLVVRRRYIIGVITIVLVVALLTPIPNNETKRPIRRDYILVSYAETSVPTWILDPNKVAFLASYHTSFNENSTDIASSLQDYFDLGTMYVLDNGVIGNKTVTTYFLKRKVGVYVSDDGYIVAWFWREPKDIDNYTETGMLYGVVNENYHITPVDVITQVLSQLKSDLGVSVPTDYDMVVNNTVFYSPYLSPYGSKLEIYFFNTGYDDSYNKRTFFINMDDTYNKSILFFEFYITKNPGDSVPTSDSYGNLTINQTTRDLVHEYFSTGQTYTGIVEYYNLTRIHNTIISVQWNGWNTWGHNWFAHLGITLLAVKS